MDVLEVELVFRGIVRWIRRKKVVRRYPQARESKAKTPTPTRSRRLKSAKRDKRAVIHARAILHRDSGGSKSLSQLDQ